MAMVGKGPALPVAEEQTHVAGRKVLGLTLWPRPAAQAAPYLQLATSEVAADAASESEVVAAGESHLFLPGRHRASRLADEDAAYVGGAASAATADRALGSPAVAAVAASAAAAGSPAHRS